MHKELLGQKVDLRTAGDLSRHFRDEVVQMAQVSMPLKDRIRIEHMINAANSVTHVIDHRPRDNIETEASCSVDHDQVTCAYSDL